ncbi:MAG: CDC27 family protein [Deltaproteobacteria bacterium]|nr:CDC27 family protein [Deltaproteobacteria bacterium]
MRSRLFVATACAVVLATGTAHADHAEAVRLFEEGRKQRDAGEYEKALKTFERSLSEEKSVGSYFNLALVLEQLGRYREAYDAFQAGKELATSRNDDRIGDLREAQAKLLDTKNHIQLAVPQDVKSAEGLRIIVDGLEVPPKQYDGYVFRAPNDHEVVVIAKGRKNVRIPAKNRQLVAVSLGEIDRSPPAPPAVVPPPPADKTPPPPPPPAEPDSGGGWPTMKWVGLAMMGAGVGAGVVGLVKNLDYLDKRSTYQDQYQKACTPTPANNNDECRKLTDEQFYETPAAIGVRKDAEANDNSTQVVLPIAYISAAALFGVGLYFFLTTESTKRSETNAARLTVTPHVGPRDGGLSVVGTF